MSGQGPTILRVTVRGVQENGIALVTDSVGREYEVRWDVFRTPFVPALNELWFIDLSLGFWTFAARFGGSAPGTGDITTETDPIATSALAGHVTAPDPHSQYLLPTELPVYLAGKENTGVAAGLISAHDAESDPHSQYATDADLGNHVSAADPHTGYQKESEKGNANGYAGLDSGGLVPSSQLPATSAGHTILDETSPLAARLKLAFQGLGVTVTDDSANNQTIVTIPGGASSGVTYRGAWGGATAYVAGDLVQYNDAIWLATAGSSGEIPGSVVGDVQQGGYSDLTPPSSTISGAGALNQPFTVASPRTITKVALYGAYAAGTVITLSGTGLSGCTFTLPSSTPAGQWNSYTLGTPAVLNTGITYNLQSSVGTSILVTLAAETFSGIVATGGDIAGAAGRHLPFRLINTAAGSWQMIGVLDERVQDDVAAMLAGSHTGISFAYNDTTGIITATVTGGGGGGGGTSAVTVGARAIRTATQSIPASTVTTVLWDAESWDIGGLHDTVTNNSRMTIPVAGKYVVTSAFTATATSGQLQMRLLKNGSLINLITQSLSAQDPVGKLTDIVDCAAGDYLEIAVYSVNATGLDTTATYFAAILQGGAATAISTNQQVFTPGAGVTALTLTSAPANPSTFRLYRNGVLLLLTTHYTLSGLTVTLTSASLATDNYTALWDVSGSALRPSQDLRWVVPSGWTSIDEFNDGVIDPAWVRVDGVQALASVLDWTERGDSLSGYHHGAVTGGASHGIFRSIGTPMTTGDAFVTCITHMAPLANYAISGITLADGVTFGSGTQAVAESYGVTTSPNLTSQLRKNTSWTTDASGETGVAIGVMVGATYWFRLVYLGSNSFRRDYSPNGIDWLKGTAQTIAFTPTYVGLHLRDNGSGTNFIASFEFLRRMAGVT